MEFEASKKKALILTGCASSPFESEIYNRGSGAVPFMAQIGWIVFRIIRSSLVVQALIFGKSCNR